MSLIYFIFFFISLLYSCFYFFITFKYFKEKKVFFILYLVSVIPIILLYLDISFKNLVFLFYFYIGIILLSVLFITYKLFVKKRKSDLIFIALSTLYLCFVIFGVKNIRNQICYKEKWLTSDYYLYSEMDLDNYHLYYQIKKRNFLSIAKSSYGQGSGCWFDVNFDSVRLIRQDKFGLFFTNGSDTKVYSILVDFENDKKMQSYDSYTVYLDFFLVKKGNLYGVVNSNGKEIIPPVYSRISIDDYNINYNERKIHAIKGMYDFDFNLDGRILTKM